jgi:hypothetical protein
MVEIALRAQSIGIDLDIAPIFPTFHEDGRAPLPFKRFVMGRRVDAAHDATLAYGDAHLAVDMKAMPPNILFSSTWRLFPMADLTRLTKVSSGGIAVASSIVHSSDEWILASLARPEVLGPPSLWASFAGNC